MDEAPVIKSSFSQTLELPPSCLEFCPAHPEYAVVGTYNLQKEDPDSNTTDADDSKAADSTKPQSRNGSLIVFRLEQGKNEQPIKVQTVLQSSALLDLRFQSKSQGSPDILAAVSSTGTLTVYQLDPTADSSSPLKLLSTSRCDDLGEDILFLQCAWHPSLRNVIGITTSTSLVRVLTLDDSWRITDSTDLDIENSLEAWCIAFSAPSREIGQDTEAFSIYAGGDDSILRYTSRSWTKDGSLTESEYGPVSVFNKHDAGVTAILPLDLRKDAGRIVLTGSYDDNLRVFLIEDLSRSFGTQKVRLVGEINLGGGVWRLNLIDISERDDFTRVRVLASCMHAGARVVELRILKDSTCEVVVLARFEEHASMNYASDFRLTENNRLRCLSSSFYDKLLCVWDYELS